MPYILVLLFLIEVQAGELAVILSVALLTLLGATGISEYSPLWLQLSALAFYSLLWAVFVLAVWGIIKRFFCFTVAVCSKTFRFP